MGVSHVSQFRALSSPTGFYLWEVYVTWTENIYPSKEIFAYIPCSSLWWYLSLGVCKLWRKFKDHGSESSREPSQTVQGIWQFPLSILDFSSISEDFSSIILFWKYSHRESRIQGLDHIDIKGQVLRLCSPSPSPPKTSRVSAFTISGPGF